ncbi:MAG: hypothetical protein SGCHY_003240, partial [Lobulomycetales sp.]
DSLFATYGIITPPLPIKPETHSLSLHHYPAGQAPTPDDFESSSAVHANPFDFSPQPSFSPDASFPSSTATDSSPSTSTTTVSPDFHHPRPTSWLSTTTAANNHHHHIDLVFGDIDSFGGPAPLLSTFSPPEMPRPHSTGTHMHDASHHHTHTHHGYSIIPDSSHGFAFGASPLTHHDAHHHHHYSTAALVDPIDQRSLSAPHYVPAPDVESQLRPDWKSPSITPDHTSTTPSPDEHASSGKLKRTWPCIFKDCSKVYTTGAGLRYHLHNFHNSPSPRFINRPAVLYPCGQCKKSHVTKAGLRYHKTKTGHH